MGRPIWQWAEVTLEFDACNHGHWINYLLSKQMLSLYGNIYTSGITADPAVLREVVKGGNLKKEETLKLPKQLTRSKRRRRKQKCRPLVSAQCTVTRCTGACACVRHGGACACVCLNRNSHTTSRRKNRRSDQPGRGATHSQSWLAAHPSILC